jgi:hypothetical protein
MKKQLKVEITEMFMAQTSPDNCFYGCIKRLRDDNDKPFVFSRIVMPDGLICASAPEQIELGENLDKIAILVIEKNLHGDAGVSTEIFGSKFFHN